MGAAIKGPALFLAQFAGDAAPFDNLAGIVNWAAGLGYKGVQIPSWDRRLFDLDLCAESATYADEVRDICADAGVEITELSAHLQGQLIAVHPAYDTAFDALDHPAVARTLDPRPRNDRARFPLAQPDPWQPTSVHATIRADRSGWVMSLGLEPSA